MINLKTKDWKIENVDTVLFDKDGTFIDLHYFWGKMSEMRSKECIRIFQLDATVFEKLCLSLGYNVKTGKMLKDGITALYSRPKIIEIFTKDLVSLGASATEKQVEEIFDRVSQEFYKNLPEYTKPIPEAINFIKKIKSAGLKTGIVTSDSIESTELAINHFGWQQLFDVAIGRENTKETKESGVPVSLALEKINATPSNAIMVGDAPMDYIAAKNAGIAKTILVSTGQIDKEELLNTSCYSVCSLKEIELY